MGAWVNGRGQARALITAAYFGGCSASSSADVASLLLILTLCWCRWRWQLHWFMALSLSPSLPPFRSLPCLSLWSFLGWNLIHQATWWCRPNPFLRRLFPLTVLQLMNTRSAHTHTRIRIRNLIAVLCVQLVNWALANHTGLSQATPAPQPTPNPAWF